MRLTCAGSAVRVRYRPPRMRTCFQPGAGSFFCYDIPRFYGKQEGIFEKPVDKWFIWCYYTQALRETSESEYGRVVELVDSLDSGSSVHCGRAGSSPASPTKERTSIWVSFFLRLLKHFAAIPPQAQNKAGNC